MPKRAASSKILKTLVIPTYMYFFQTSAALSIATVSNNNNIYFQLPTFPEMKHVKLQKNYYVCFKAFLSEGNLSIQ